MVWVVFFVCLFLFSLAFEAKAKKLSIALAVLSAIFAITAFVQTF